MDSSGQNAVLPQVDFGTSPRRAGYNSQLSNDLTVRQFAARTRREDELG
jgi:hypothetical protein